MYYIMHKQLFNGIQIFIELIVLNDLKRWVVLSARSKVTFQK